MDDTLEIPRPRTEKIQEGDDHSSGDEDSGLDWTKLPKLGATARPIIPKRGEKDFEPAPGGGSGLQLHVLDRSRDAMFEALRANRTISSKTISYGIWYPSINRVHVTTARGIHFSTMGCSISRMAQYENADNQLRGPSPKLPKRLELLPEEALYLIERSALFCYKSVSSGASLVEPSNYETSSPGAPMSIQQAFAEMIGREEMTLERYQVYAYLKRLGFILMRAEPPTPEYPVAPSVSLAVTQPRTVTRKLMGLFSRLASNIMSVARLFHRIDWWRRPQLHRQKTTQDIFKALRFIPCGHTIPLYHPVVKSQHSKSSPPSPYKIFFHVYKPSTPFRKTAPPAPDFHLVVVDARTTSIPSLQELTALFGVLPEMPLSPPRKRGTPASTKQPSDSRPTDVRPTTPKTVPQEGLPANTTPSQPTPSWSSALWTFFHRLLSFLPSFRTVTPLQSTKPTFAPPKSNPFPALKTGKRIIVIAAVDAGSISFFRFGQGVFEEWPML
ncbi:tRNA-splicing endonuclease subunit sen54 N-term-domain-containing protein [Butyriboletus roseoflavus]|nr:tRNA-splicing endonuclease subunit sen54 N-term-domain-containing protein [Butyriboletus roseoflavus]